jgi:Cation efflux family
VLLLEIFEQGVPPRFRLSVAGGRLPPAAAVTIETVRPGGQRQVFVMADRGGYLESVNDIPEPHAFTALVRLDHETQTYSVAFEEHEDTHGAAHRDNNLRAAIIHVLADAAVSVLVIVGLLLGRFLGWAWMDPLAGICGAAVIGTWSYALVRDTGAILLDMTPDRRMADRVRTVIEADPHSQACEGPLLDGGLDPPHRIGGKPEPFSGSKRLTACINPTLPSEITSEIGMP